MREIVLGQKIYTAQGVIVTKLHYNNGYYSIIKQLEGKDRINNEPVLKTVGEINLNPKEMDELIHFVDEIKETEPKQCCG